MRDAIRSFLKALVPARLRPKLGRLADRMRRFGLRYKCPLCNAHLRAFRPHGLALPVLGERRIVGGGYRKNATCPACGSVDRERLVYLYLLHKTDVFRVPRRVLHIAPEPKLAEVFQGNALVDYLSADLHSENVMVKLDVTDIQFPDNSFDAVICNHVLEHVEEDRKAMSEIHRSLKAGGWAILQVPFAPSLEKTHEDSSITTRRGREQAFGQEDHVRIYGMDVKDRLEKAAILTLEGRMDDRHRYLKLRRIAIANLSG